jgi:predicted metal-dependent phosphoesterase TrpH
MEVFAACHVHSDWSYDGSWPLKTLSEKFSRRGDSVLLMTEHDRGFTNSRFDEYRASCAEASSSQILVVPGMEYSDAANRVHVLVWGVSFLGEGLPTADMLEAVRVANGIAVLAHPSRKDVWRNFEPSWADRLLGVEGWNRKYDGWAPSKTAPALLQSSSAIPFVGLDFHTDRQSFPLAMALDLPGRVTEEEVLRCLRSRRCSARAFGVPLDHELLRKTMPALGIAEQGRRGVASIVKRSKTQKR